MSTLELKELSHPAGEVIKIAAGKTLDLKTQGSVTMPTGSVLQVVHGTESTELTLTTTTYTDTGLTATITPKSTTSTILIMWNLQASLDQADSGIGTKLLRDSTAVYTSASLYDIYTPTGAGERHRPNWTHLDSPNTTSAITYKVQAGAYLSRTCRLNNVSNSTQITLMEIAG